MSKKTRIYTAKPKPNARERKIIEYLNQYNVDYELVPLSKMKKEDIVELIQYSETGIDELVFSTFKYNENMSFNQLVESVFKKKTTTLKAPISVSEDGKMVIGADPDDFPTLLPKQIRRLRQKMFASQTAGNLSPAEPVNGDASLTRYEYIIRLRALL